MLLLSRLHLVRVLLSTALCLIYCTDFVSSDRDKDRLEARRLFRAQNRKQNFRENRRERLLEMWEEADEEKDDLEDDESNESANTEQRLLKVLLDDYDVDARGVDDVRKTVTVMIDFLLLRIQALDERSQVLTTTGLLICDWEDNRLQWNISDYDELEDVVVKPDRIWLPELSLMNGAEELAPDFQLIRALVRHDGHVHWEPGGVFMTTCDIDIRYFPFDDQACAIRFGAWAYYSARMNITTNSSEIQTHEFKLNGEWEVYRTRAHWQETTIPCCPDVRYSYVEFTLYLGRRYTFYVMNVIVPCLLLSVLVLVGFCLPPDAGEKISLGISVLLAFTVFLLMVAENIPRTSLRTPVIVIYLACTLGLGTASVCMTVIVLNLHHRDIERPVPNWARVVVFRYLARLLCVGARKPKTMAVTLQHTTSDGDDTTSESTGLKDGLRQFVRDGELIKAVTVATPNNNRVASAVNRLLRIDSNESINHCDRGQEWKELANVIDRLFFAITCTMMCASVMIIVLAPCYKDVIKIPND